MDDEQRRSAKRQMMVLMQMGRGFQEAANIAGVQTSRSTAYRWFQAFRLRGEAALHDGRHGHRAKVLEPVLQWLKDTCATTPQAPSSLLQKELHEHLGVQISITHLNRIRAAHDLTRQAVGMKKHHGHRSSSELTWQEGAGGLLLVAAAGETGLLSCLEEALPPVSSSGKTSRALLLTLLLLHAVGLRRTRDLRGYTGAALGLLTGRKRAYGYFHVERFLTQQAKSGGSERLTTTLGTWTARLWHSGKVAAQEWPSCFYIDGHRKPVYTDKLIPRGLIGNSGKVLGARALVLLHDEQGHPLLATTHRGDQHLTIGMPQILARYQASGAVIDHSRLIVDREGMAACFLRDLAEASYTVVTLLRTDQYTGINSFTEVGTFVPLTYDRDGQVVREVAPACFALPLPDQVGQTLPLRVALIRDWRRQIRGPEEEEASDERNAHKRGWWREGWKAQPTPAPPTTAKLIPIVTTASTCDAVELAITYTQRWSAQENIIRDFLLPLGLDTNHGYGKTEVENSEVSKKRSALEKRLSNIQRWTVSAQDRAQRASKLYNRLCKQAKQQGEQLYRALNERVWELEAQSTMSSYQLRAESKRLQAEADAELAPLWQRVYQVLDRSNKEYAKCERYAHEQCDILRELEDLEKSERVMYELDNRKDQLMTGCKLALANLVMWARDHYFPASYTHATWGRLAPFFQLTGRVLSLPDEVCVELHAFNDRKLNRDLLALCQRVNHTQPRLPDGRLLLFTARALACPILDVQKCQIA